MMKPLVLTLKNSGADGINNLGFILNYDSAIVKYEGLKNVQAFNSVDAGLIDNKQGKLAVEFLNDADGEVTADCEVVELNFVFVDTEQNFEMAISDFSAQNVEGGSIVCNFPDYISFSAETGFWTFGYYWKD